MLQLGERSCGLDQCGTQALEFWEKRSVPLCSWRYIDCANDSELFSCWNNLSPCTHRRCCCGGKRKIWIEQSRWPLVGLVGEREREHSGWLLDNLHLKTPFVRFFFSSLPYFSQFCHSYRYTHCYLHCYSHGGDLLEEKDSQQLGLWASPFVVLS